MARTFDFRDPAQKAAYVEESALQWMLYGSVSISLDEQTGLITLYDGRDVQPDGSVITP